jgi:hypothetical protein
MGTAGGRNRSEAGITEAQFGVAPESLGEAMRRRDVADQGVNRTSHG